LKNSEKSERKLGQKVIIPFNSSNSLKNELVSVLKFKAPIGKVGDYDFGDEFKHEHEEFGLFCIKLSIIDFILVDERVFGTNQKGEIVPFYQLLDSYTDIIIKDIIKKKYPNTSDYNYKIKQDMEWYRLYLTKINIALFPNLKRVRASQGKQQVEKQMSIYVIMYCTIFQNKFIGMDEDEKVMWVRDNMDELDVCYTFLLWYIKIVYNAIDIYLVEYS